MDISNEDDGVLVICTECGVNPVPLYLLEEEVCQDCVGKYNSTVKDLDFNEE